MANKSIALGHMPAPQSLHTTEGSETCSVCESESIMTGMRILYQP